LNEPDRLFPWMAPLPCCTSGKHGYLLHQKGYALILANDLLCHSKKILPSYYD
jgi:hypothetical protein